jgi:hypothetical protein
VKNPESGRIQTMLFALLPDHRFVAGDDRIDQSGVHSSHNGLQAVRINGVRRHERFLAPVSGKLKQISQMYRFHS